MGYSSAMGGGSCGCSTPVGMSGKNNDDMKSAEEIVSGLKVIDAMNEDMIIDQGTTKEMLICFTDGMIGEEIKCIKPDGTLLFQKDKRPCYKKDDLVRLMGFNDCASDSSQIFKVDADPVLVDGLWNLKLVVDDTSTPPGPDPVTAFAHLLFEDGQYCFAGLTVAQMPIGCIQLTPPVPETSPRLMLHIPAENLAITGGIFMRDDYYDEFGVSFDGGYTATVANSVINRAKAGDYVMSQDAGVCVPNKIKEIRQIEVLKNSDGCGSEPKCNETEIIEKWFLEKSVAGTKCVLANIRRGLNMNLEIQQDGPCWRVVIPGAETAGYQLDPMWKKDQGYYIGEYSIAITWGVLRNAKLAPRTEIIKTGNAFIRPTHIFSTSSPC